MTGEILRKLREHYALSRRDVEKAAGLPAHSLRHLEAGLASWCARNHDRRAAERYRAWRSAIAAIRTLRDSRGLGRPAPAAEEPPLALTSARVNPEGTTHMCWGRPLRVATLHGRMAIFRHDGGDWVRSTLTLSDIRGAAKV